MKAYLKTLLIAAALVLVIVLAVVVYPRLSARYEAPPAPPAAADSAAETPVPAPDVKLYNAELQPVMLSDYFGKPVVLNFWATWCVHCVAELPIIDAIAEEYADELNFLIVDLADGEMERIELATEFIEKNGYSFPLFFDEGPAAAAYGVRAIPVTVFLDAEGNIFRIHDGSMNETILRNYIQELIGDTEA